MVDVHAESYHVARDYMVRLEAADLNDDTLRPYQSLIT